MLSHTRTLRLTLALGAAALTAALIPSAQASSVCNEVGKGHLGGSYEVTGAPDRNPPARYTSGLELLANGTGEGLTRAAERSPALSQCEVHEEDNDGNV